MLGRRPVQVAVSISLVSFLVYLSSLHNEFVQWDDPVYIFENPAIRSFNVYFFKWAFLKFHANNWHPLTWISHALDYAVWGLNPLGHHLTNNILHALNTFLVVVLVRLLGVTHLPARPGLSAFTLIAAATTGLLFGLHPLHVESVAWVAERKDLLCALFFLLSIVMYVHYVTLPSLHLHKGRSEKGAPSGGDIGPEAMTKPALRFLNKKYLSSFGFFALALLSKPMAVSLPVVLLILDWYPFERIRSLKSFRAALIEKFPFVALSLISSTVTILAQKGAMALTEDIPLSSRTLVAAKSLIAYLWKMIVPMNLSPYYPYPKDITPFRPEYLSAMVLLLGMTVVCFVMIRKNKLWISVWGYYVVTLIPVLGIIQVGGQAMADRYTYLPSAGPFLLAGLGVAWAFEKSSTLMRRALMVKVITAGIAITVFVSLVYLTALQITIWKDSFTLWDYVIEKQPSGVPLAYTNRGLAFAAVGRFDRAIEDLNTAIALDPSNFEVYNNRGLAYSETGQFDRAIADFDKAISLNVRFYQAYNNKGKVYGQTGSFDKAVEQFSKAIDSKPDASLAYGNRGLAYSLMGEYEKAMEDLNRAIASDQNNSEAYGARGNIYLRTGSKELAVADFQKACDLGDRKGCAALRQLQRQMMDRAR